MKAFLLLLVPTIFILSCQSIQKNKEAEIKETIEETFAEAVVDTVSPALRFECKFKEGATEEMIEAETVVSVYLGDEVYPIDTIMACGEISREEYKNHEIPENALDAAGGWWAGGGDYFYAIEEKGQIVIYQGWLDEMQEDEGYHYKQVKVLK